MEDLEAQLRAALEEAGYDDVEIGPLDMDGTVRMSLVARRTPAEIGWVVYSAVGASGAVVVREGARVVGRGADPLRGLLDAARKTSLATGSRITFRALEDAPEVPPPSLADEAGAALAAD